MERHYNLYYIFLEDKKTNPMPQEAADRVRRNIAEFYRKLKPPPPEEPPEQERAP